MLDRKQFLIIQKLVETQIISKQVLQESLNMTPRQIDYSLEKINDLLRLNKIDLINYDGAFISVSEAAHNYLLNLSSEVLDPDKYLFDRKERIDLLFLILINGGAVGINDLASVLDVSLSTMHKDLRELKTKLLPKNLDLNYQIGQGYQIVGKEKDIRWHLAEIIVNRIATDNYRMFNWFFNVVQGQDIKKYIDNISNEAHKLNISFVEDHKMQFIYTYVAELTRLREHPNYIPSSKINYQKLEDSVEYKLATRLLQYESISNTNSIIYVTILLLCTTIGGESKLDFDHQVFEYNQAFVHEFALLSGVDFINMADIEKQTFTHFRSMYFRELFGFPINNPLTNQIKAAYSDVFALVKRALLVLKDQIGILPDSEVAFLTIHFLNFIYSKNNTTNEKPVAAIVCQNGIATSTLLYLQLTNIFPEIEFLPPFKYDELQGKMSSIDLIFSTFYRAKLFAHNKPCFIVNPIMTPNEKSLLIQKVHMLLNRKNSLSLTSVINVVQKYVSDQTILDNIYNDLNVTAKHPHHLEKTKRIGLLDVINPDMLQLNINVTSSQQAIRIASNPLIKDKIITQDYVEKMLKRNYDDFIIAPRVVLPHSSPSDGANNIGMSITTLKSPLKFGDKFGGKVKYIFMLSAIDNSTHLGVLKDLMQIISDSKFFNLLDKGNKQNIISYMNEKLS